MFPEILVPLLWVPLSSLRPVTGLSESNDSGTWVVGNQNHAGS